MYAQVALQMNEKIYKSLIDGARKSGYAYKRIKQNWILFKQIKQPRIDELSKYEKQIFKKFRRKCDE